MEVVPIITAVAAATSAYVSKKNSDIERKAIKAEQAANKQQYDLNVRQAKEILAEEQRKNRNLLAQQQSAYRARLGAAGMSEKSGSGQAVLNAMNKEYDAEDKYLVNQANISLEALLNTLNAKNTQNLLSLSSNKNKDMTNTLGSLNTFTSSAGRSVLK